MSAGVEDHAADKVAIDRKSRDYRKQDQVSHPLREDVKQHRLLPINNADARSGPNPAHRGTTASAVRVPASRSNARI